MRRRNFRPLTEASPKISIRDHNDLMRTIEGLSRQVSGPHVAGSSSSAGNISSVLSPAFWAKLTFIGTGSPTPLSYAEQLENPDGTLTDFADQHLGFASTDPANPNPGLQNWPAYDLTGATHKAGDIVRLIPSKGGEYYEVVGSGTPSVSISLVQVNGVRDGNFVYPGNLQVMSPGGLTLSNGPSIWIFGFMAKILSASIPTELLPGDPYIGIPNGNYVKGGVSLPLYWAVGPFLEYATCSLTGQLSTITY